MVGVHDGSANTQTKNQKLFRTRDERRLRLPQDQHHKTKNKYIPLRAGLFATEILSTARHLHYVGAVTSMRLLGTGIPKQNLGNPMKRGLNVRQTNRTRPLLRKPLTGIQLFTPKTSAPLYTYRSAAFTRNTFVGQVREGTSEGADTRMKRGSKTTHEREYRDALVIAVLCRGLPC